LNGVAFEPLSEQYQIVLNIIISVENGDFLFYCALTVFNQFYANIDTFWTPKIIKILPTLRRGSNG